MSNDRDCDNCIHRKENGCEKWNCEFEPKYIERSVIEDIKAEILAYAKAPNLSDKDGVEDGLMLSLKLIDKHIER